MSEGAVTSTAVDADRVDAHMKTSSGGMAVTSPILLADAEARDDDDPAFAERHQ